MCLVLWPSAHRPEMNVQWLQFADSVDFVLPVLFVVTEQAMFVFTFTVLIEIKPHGCRDGRSSEQFNTFDAPLAFVSIYCTDVRSRYATSSCTATKHSLCCFVQSVHKMS